LVENLGPEIDTAWFWEISQIGNNIQWEPYNDLLCMKIEISFYKYKKDTSLSQFSEKSGNHTYTLDF
jgi:hypothetical protein